MGTMSIHVAMVAFATMMTPVQGHGRLVEPPSRSSMWRFGFKNPPNYNDNQLFCGGFNVQWNQNGGRCGVCGDNDNGSRDNEYPGKYANGIIVRKYEIGQDIDVIVHLTANHKGWFEFRLCQNEAVSNSITRECLDRHLLTIKETKSTRYYVDATKASYYAGMNLTLPAGLTCADCVLQWKYNTGNSWGTGADGVSGIGRGPQEQFYGCADVSIGRETKLGDTHNTVEIPDGDTDDRLAWEKVNADRQTTNQTENENKDGNCTCVSGATMDVVSKRVLAIMLGYYVMAYVDYAEDCAVFIPG